MNSIIVNIPHSRHTQLAYAKCFLTYVAIYNYMAGWLDMGGIPAFSDATLSGHTIRCLRRPCLSLIQTRKLRAKRLFGPLCPHGSHYQHSK